MPRLETGSVPLQAVEFRRVGGVRGLPTELPMVTVRTIATLCLLGAALAGPGYAQVADWQEHVEIVAKTVVVRIDPVWLQTPELFNPGLWDIQVGERPTRVLSVQKLLGRGFNDQPENTALLERLRPH